jgi:hypothetical protein
MLYLYHSFRLLFSKKICGNSYRSLNGKLTPVKVIRHTMPQKGIEHFNLTGFKCTNGYILTEKVSWCPVTGVNNLGNTLFWHNICTSHTFSSHLYIWSQWGWNVLFLFVASYALLLSQVLTFRLDSGFETLCKNFHKFFNWKSNLELMIIVL